jgi:hypothetical protein
MVKQQKIHQLLQNNAQEPPKKENDVKIKQPIPMAGVIYINNFKINFLEK